MVDPGPSADPAERRLTLTADCAQCFGLCCVAPAFSASADFAIDKPAGQPCPNLADDFGCTIHAGLRDRGFPGCTVFDCQGAGQKVAQVTFGGRSWRDDPSSAPLMFDVFQVVRALHELLWYVSEALRYPAAAPVHAKLERVAQQIELVTLEPAERLRRWDLAAEHHRVDALLLRTSELVRAGTRGRSRRRRGLDQRGADLTGRDLTRTDLRGADLRGAQLIGADLRGADLGLTDLIGADLRAARVGGADLRDSLFLTQPQLAAATGDRQTSLPASFRRPPHWDR